MQRLWISLSSKGWKLTEPLDDEIPRELMTADDFIYACALMPKDIEELSALDRGTIDTTILPEPITTLVKDSGDIKQREQRSRAI